MVIKILFIALLVICSCQEHNPTSKAKETLDTLTVENGKVHKEAKENQRIEAWEKEQDSLRNILLTNKENEVLKKSFLQEMYIRGAVKESKGLVSVSLRFDLHGPDCGAPDCYYNDVQFSFQLKDSLQFPQNIIITQHDHGCSRKEQTVKGQFQLQEQTDKHLIYHCEKLKTTMVLFSSLEKAESLAYYFTHVEQGKINGTTVYSNFFKEYDEEDKNSIYPFTSWSLSTNEYEVFL